MMTAVTGFAWADGELLRRKVVQCALSRVCGGCGRSLGRPVAFLGEDSEVARNSFHLPPLHTRCAEDLRATLGPDWHVILTSGFEFARPGRDDEDPEPRFAPYLIG